VCDPRARLDRPRDLRDRAVRHAEEDELRTVLAQLDAPRAQAGGQRRADAAATDHVDAFHHLALQFHRGYRAAEL
jgi:hypothetical protein